jgi:prepilin-type N-terminal cleavage/methylation domain-containing protein
MSRVSNRSSRGFSLIELMVALALGLLITGAAVKLYSTGVDATWVVQQRAEMQQDLRAAEDMLLKDISLAGAGLTSIPGESVKLPFGTIPIYGCSAGPVCPPNGALQYPCIGGACGAKFPPTLYPIMPGFQRGINPPGSAIPSDIITVVYSDTTLALNCYSGPAGGPSAANNAISFNATGNVLTFTAPVNPPPASCILPPGLAFPQALNNTVNGLQPGDLILVGPNSLGTTYIGEVTNVAPPNAGNAPAAPGSAYTITFANGDTLNINQAGSVNDLTNFAPAGGGQVGGLVATRIFVITYFLKNFVDGAGNVTTILYRQVNGQQATPLVDNIANLQFTYDTYDNSGNLLNATGDGGEACCNISPNLIRKVNIAHLTIHGQLYGTKSSLMATQGFQSFDVQTSISARNMSYTNRY